MQDVDLATQIGADEANISIEDVPPDTKTSVLVDLRHSQLPVLDDTELIEWNKEEGTVSITDHPVLRSSAVTSLLESTTEAVDTKLSALTHRRRRRMLSVLRDRQTPIDIHELAEAIAGPESDGAHAPDQQVHETLVTLHHTHLPVLEDAGFIEFDHEDNTIELVANGNGTTARSRPAVVEPQICVLEHGQPLL